MPWQVSHNILFEVNYKFIKGSLDFSLGYLYFSNLCSVHYLVAVVIKLVKWSVDKRLPMEHGVTYQIINAMADQARNHQQARHVTQSLVSNGESSIPASVVEVISLKLYLCYIVLCAVWLSRVIRRAALFQAECTLKSQVYYISHLLFRDEFQLCSHRLLQRQAQPNKASSRDDRKSSKQHQLVSYERNSDEMRQRRLGQELHRVWSSVLWRMLVWSVRL